MWQRVPRRRKPAAVFLLAALALSALGAAGCSRQPDTSRASVESCVEFGVAAVRHHVTVTSLPPACRGLTAAQVDFAVGSALHSAAVGARGKARQRALIGQASHFLAHMIVAVPARPGEPRAAAPAAHQIGRTALGLLALGSWLVTIALGLWMMARWLLGSRRRHTLAGRLRRSPALNLGHLGLAVVSLLTWIGYLVTGVTGLAWTAAVLLTLVTGLGMALAFLSPPGRRPAVFRMGAHVVFATVTVLFAFLAAIGIG